MSGGTKATARAGLMLLGILAVGCQSPAMRQLSSQGAMPTDLAERISRLGKGQNVYSAGASRQQEEEALQALVRSQMPDLPASGALQPPPLPERKDAPASPPMPPIQKTSGSAARLGTPQPVELGRLHDSGVVVAVVNGEAILEEEVRLAIAQGGGDGEGPAQRRKSAVSLLVDRELIVQDVMAKLSKNPQAQKFMDKLKELAGKDFERTLRTIRDKSKAASEEDFQEMLKAQGIPLDLMRRQSERNFIAVNYMQQRVTPMTERISGADLRGYYESHPEDFTVPDSVAWKHIFIAAAAFKSRDDARRLAESLHARLRAGEDFKGLSKQYCHGDSALRDGDGLGRKRGEIKPPELEAPLFKAAAGELLPVMELRNGYHVARVESREFAGLKPFDEKVQKQIRSRLREEIAQREMKRLVSELKRVAVIEYPGQ
ncbi:MAG: peptidylprolyl isomerase [Planctomycetota bacterium]